MLMLALLPHQFPFLPIATALAATSTFSMAAPHAALPTTTTRSRTTSVCACAANGVSVRRSTPLAARLTKAVGFQAFNGLRNENALQMRTGCAFGLVRGLGFHVRDARTVNRVVASESAPCNVGAAASGFGSGSCLKYEVGLSVGFGFKVCVALEVRRVCLGRMDFSVGVVESDEKAFGVVEPAKEEIYSDAVRALERGHVVAVPTDTLYGLACDASSEEGIRRVYEIKERKLSSPLAVCVADVDVVCVYGETAHVPAGLLHALLPGAVTLLLPRRESGLLSASLNPGVGSIGIRIPDSNFIRGLSRSFGGALALTSANTSSHASTVRVDEFEHLWPHCAFVFDAGTLPGSRAGSTIVDLTQEGVFKVVRPGSVLQKTKETLARFGLRDISSFFKISQPSD